MKKVLELIQLAEINGANFFIKDDKLGIKGLGDTALPGDLLGEIKSRREEILDYLTRDAQSRKLPKIKKLSDHPSRIPLSYSQERFWAMDKLSGSADYHVSGVFRLTGNLDVSKLKRSVIAVVERQEVLRTIYKEKSGVPYQELLPMIDFSVEEADISKLTAQERLDTISDRVSRPFDLAMDYMLRASILKECEDVFLLVIVMHPMVADKWGMPIVVREIGLLYQAYQQARQPELPVLSLQYADYCLWQRTYLSGELLEDKLSYWKEQLKGLEPLQIPTDYARPSVQSKVGSRYGFSLGQALIAKLKALSREKGATLFVGLLSVYKILLHRYTGQSDICVGLPIANTEREELKVRSLVGWFVNSLALRATIKRTDNFEQVLCKVKNVTLSAYEHQDAPFELVVDRIVHDRNQSRGALFQTMFVLGGHEVIEKLDLGNAVMEPVKTAQETSEFDLTLSARETSDGLSIDMVYCTDLFREDTIRRFSKHFEDIIKAVLADQKQPIGALHFLGDEERIELLETFNNTAVAYPRDKTVVDLFSGQVLQTPDKIAVVCEGETLTYRELDTRSNHLAHYLLSRGVKKEELVAICMGRGVALIVGILGIMKGGGAYVPIDPVYPKQRIAYMLADTASRIVLSTSGLREVVEGYAGVMPIYLDEEKLEDYPLTLPDVDLSPHNLAYVIYTSGSTGKPKGVMIEQGSLVNMILWHQKAYRLEASSRGTLYAGTGFDASTAEIYPYLTIGASLYPIVADEIRMDTKKLEEFLKHNKITHCYLPTQLCHELIDQGIALENITILAAGDALKIPKPTSLNIYNNYGPTENTVVATWFTVQDYDGLNIPIGKPISNVQIYILDEDLHLQPRGIAGELCIGGAGLARGYLNRPDLTAEKFVDNPFQSGTRLYRTGDLARWLPNGNIEFLGRKDHQVKIRGYRIELGEIEIQLQDIPWIKQAVVLVREDKTGSKYLVGYVVLEAGQELDRTAIQAHLKSQLPDYMVPQWYVGLPRLPLTPNDKVDLKALPEPDGTALQRGVYVAPRTELECDLVSIWQAVLGIDRIGVCDDFFELGGDSIKAIQLRTRIRRLGYNIKVGDFFESRTIDKSVNCLRTAQQVQGESGTLSGEAPLLPIQRRFFETSYDERDHYNQSILLAISKAIKAEGLRDIIQVLSDQHDGLRLRYTPGESGFCQSYSSKALVLDLEQVSGHKTVEALCARYQGSLDIERGPMVRMVWIETPASEYANRLFITVHRLVIDAVSWHILLEDLSTLLIQQTQGLPLALELKQTSYRQWGERLVAYAADEELLVERSYWTAVLGKVKAFPQDTDYTGLTPFRRVKRHKVVLSEWHTHDLLRGIHQAYGTAINDLLLTALSLTLTEWLGEYTVVIGLKGHGREDLFDEMDVSKTIGWFSSLYPVVLRVTPGQAIGQQIIETKESLRGIPHKGMGYSVLRYLSNEESMRVKTPFDDIVFSYWGDLDAILTPSGGLLSRAVEPMGAPVGSANAYQHKLSVNAIVSDGALQVTWSYDANRYNEKTIRSLAAHYNDYLAQAIAHCKEVVHPIKTVSDYGLPSVITQAELESFSSDVSHPAAITDIYPLSPLQEGLLFHSLYDASGQAYLVRFSCDFTAGVDGNAFRQAWKHLSRQHSILRTAIYAHRLSIPVQVVYQEVDIPIAEIDYRDLAKDQIESTWSDYLLEEKHAELDLSKAPPMRMSLVYLPDGIVKFLMTNHHVLWDGWSFENLMGEFMHIYEYIIKGKDLPEIVADNYVDLLHYVNKQGIVNGEAYWRGYLSDVEEPSYVPYIKDMSERNGLASNAELRLDIPADLEERLKQYSQSNGLTVNTLLQAAWGYLLSRYNNRDTVVFGATVSGRDVAMEHIESRVGLYINTLPVVTHIDPSSRIVDWLRALQFGHTLGRADYGYLPLSRIQATTKIRGHLFDSLLVFENYPLNEALQGMGGVLEMANIDTAQGTNYVLSLICYLIEGGMTVSFGYHDALLDKEDVVRIRDHFIQLLERMLSGMDRVSELDCLSDAEHIELLETFNSTAVAYPDDKTVVDLFSQQVVQTPECIAVAYEGETLTYRELDVQTNQLAHYLLSREVKKEDVVAICMERSIAVIVGILGIMKSGSAYVPIDPAYPRQRIAYMLSSSSSHVVLSTSGLRGVLAGHTTVEPIYLDEVEALGDYPSSLPDVGLSSHNLAYVIYTSGSTGKPKGVMMEHRSLVNLLLWQESDFKYKSKRKFLQFASMSFDVSFQEVFCAICFGGSLHLLSEARRGSLEEVSNYIADQKVTHVFLPFVVLETVCEFLNGKEKLFLKEVVTAGEQLELTSGIRKFIGYQNCRLINQYGPTEAHVVTKFEVEDHDEFLPPIGQPVPNTQIYIVDDHKKLQPRGIAGELCIGGVQVARGYLNRPDLAAEKFIDNPFQPGGRIYCTGDLARWLPDGNIEFLGRKDHQVKIRGHRVELGEIEGQLQEIPWVKQSAVLARQHHTGSKYLVGYVVVEAERELDRAAIQAHLKTNLPDYMIPRFYVGLSHLPLTNNGKFDRKALPEPDDSALQRREYLAPRTELEQNLVLIWQEVLGLDKIGVCDDFFELGGDSIKAIRVVSQIRSKSTVTIEVRSIFDYTTIEELAKSIKISNKEYVLAYKDINENDFV